MERWGGTAHLKWCCGDCIWCSNAQLDYRVAELIGLGWAESVKQRWRSGGVLEV